MALSITITDAGRAALINAQNTGSTAMVIDRIGVSASHATGNLKALTTLPNERKKLATFAGEVVADDMIHVTVRDETNDAYDLRAFGIYFANGVLFAVCTQAEPIMQKAAAAMLLQSVDIALVTLDTDNIEFGGSGFSNPPATTERLGVVELATVEETAALEDATRAITPFSLGRTLLTWAQNFAARLHGHDVGDVDGLGLALAGKAAKDHKHDASDTTSGIFDGARIPKLSISWINGLTEALADRSLRGHGHYAADVIDGVFAVARIPKLAISWITDLAETLATKANADGANLTGIARIASFFLGTGRAYVYPAGDGINIRVGATGVEHYWSFTSQGNVLLNGGPMWHLGNFDPDSRVSVAATNLGKTVNVPLTTLSSAAQYAALPIGFSSMVAPGSVGTPGGYGYLFKMARRDSNDGWSGLWINHTAALGDAPELFVGTALVGSVLPVWTRAWTAANFDPNAKANRDSPNFTGTVLLPSNTIIKKEGPGTGEGGQLILQRPDVSALGSDVAVDIQGNSFRIWEMQAPYRGVAVDLSSLLGPGTKLLTEMDFANGPGAVAGVSTSTAITPAALWAFARSIGPSGYAQIPGTPIIMQWGSSTGSLIEGQVTALLPIAFGGGCFFAAATPRNASSEPWADFMMQVVAKYLDRIIFFAQRGYDGRNTSSGYEWLALGFSTGTPNAVFSAGGGTGGGGGGGGGEFNPEL